MFNETFWDLCLIQSDTCLSKWTKEAIVNFDICSKFIMAWSLFHRERKWFYVEKRNSTGANEDMTSNQRNRLVINCEWRSKWNINAKNNCCLESFVLVVDIGHCMLARCGCARKQDARPRRHSRCAGRRNRRRRHQPPPSQPHPNTSFI